MTEQRITHTFFKCKLNCVQIYSIVLKPVNTYYNPALFLFSSPVPKDRDKFYFKLRQGVQKKVVLSVQQMGNKELGIERYGQDAHYSRSFFTLLFFQNKHSFYVK